MTERQTQPRAELHLRGLASPGIAETRRRVVDRLEELTETDALDSYDVDVWGTEVILEDTDDLLSQRLREQYEAFRDWANERGCSLDPAFSRRQLRSMIDEESREVLSLPCSRW